MKLIIASRTEVWTHWARPVRSLSRSAARMPCVSSVPAAMSEIAIPARHGPVPGGPVTLMIPLIP